MWLQFILPLTGDIVIQVQNGKKKMYSLKRLSELNFKCHVLHRRRQDPFYDKGKEQQYEPHISMAADQACLWIYTLGLDALRKMINDNGMTLRHNC